MEDSQIVDLYWQRSADAIVESSAKYGGYCHAIALRILGSHLDAEECVNDTWVGAWNAMPIHRPVSLPSFLGKLTRRAACNRLDAIRAKKRGGGELPLVLEELSGCIPAASDPARDVEDGELARAVNHFLRRLPERTCSVFLRRYWYAKPLSDIAARYGMSQGAVKASLFRTRQKLRDHLEKEGLL